MFIVPLCILVCLKYACNMLPAVCMFKAAAAAMGSNSRSQLMPSTGSLDTYEDTHEDEDALPLGQHPHSSIPRAGSSALPRAKPISSQASDTLTPAQQRELERESAYQASTGSVAGAFTDSSAAASGKSTASHLSWGAIAGQGNTGASQGDPTVRVGSQPGSVGSQSAAELDQRTAVKHQSLGDSESEADMEDYDPRAFATGSSTDSARGAGANYADPIGQAQGWNPRTNGASTGSRVQPSMGGDEGYGQEDSSDSRRFMVNRDPADPRSVVGAHLSRDGQAQAGRQQSAASNAAGAGMTSLRLPPPLNPFPCSPCLHSPPSAPPCSVVALGRGLSSRCPLKIP